MENAMDKAATPSSWLPEHMKERRVADARAALQGVIREAPAIIRAENDLTVKKQLESQLVKVRAALADATPGTPDAVAEAGETLRGERDGTRVDIGNWDTPGSRARSAFRDVFKKAPQGFKGTCEVTQTDERGKVEVNCESTQG